MATANCPEKIYIASIDPVVTIFRAPPAGPAGR
jgi:hypothetical protein